MSEFPEWATYYLKLRADLDALVERWERRWHRIVLVAGLSLLGFANWSRDDILKLAALVLGAS